VTGHLLLCMLTNYVKWHLRQKWWSLPVEDAEREPGKARRHTPVEAAQVSEATEAKAAKRPPEGLPVQSPRTPVEHMGTPSLTRVHCPTTTPKSLSH